MPDVTDGAALGAILASTALVFGAGARMRGRWCGIGAAVIFVSTPVIWRQYQVAPATLYPLLYVAGWLAAIAFFEATAQRAALLVAGGLLGAGVYVSPAAAVMMTAYLLLTIAAVPSLRRWPPTALAWFAGAFAVAAAPFAARMVLRPDRFRLIVNTAHLYDANRFNVLQGIREMTSWVGLTARSEVYYDYFNPAFLFLSPGVLLWPLAILIPVGLYHIVDGETHAAARLAVGGFLAAPLAASLTALAPTPERILFITPFAAMVAMFGLERLVQLIAGARSPRTANP